VTAQLVEAVTDRHLWADTVVGEGLGQELQRDTVRPTMALLGVRKETTRRRTPKQ
jgi:hypothetical protein